MCHSVCAFGYNGFGQIAPDATRLTAFQLHPRIKRVLLATWEATIVLTEEDRVQWWGYGSQHQQQLCDSLGELPGPIHHLFGDINIWLGALDAQGSVWYTSLVLDLSAGVKWQQLASDALDAVHCPDLSTVLVLTGSGHVDSYAVSNTSQPICFGKRQRLDNLPRVHALAASVTHVLFSTAGLDPVYALGSNRFSQLGLDTSTAQRLDACTPVEFFSGMGMMTQTEDGNHHAAQVACGLFHSAVILAGELYTFGWNKDGRLGWHDQQQEEDRDVIMPGVFLDNDDRPVEVNVTKVECGSAHTLVLDGKRRGRSLERFSCWQIMGHLNDVDNPPDEGHAWSCGSNKYGQLGRPKRSSRIDGDDDDKEQHECVFRRCAVYKGAAKDIYAARWSSFLILP